MRFMLQDKESFITRLQFVIERDRNDRATYVSNDLTQAIATPEVPKFSKLVSKLDQKP